MAGTAAMRELLRTGNLVRLSFLQALLADAGIESLVLDANIGALFRQESFRV